MKNRFERILLGSVLFIGAMFIFQAFNQAQAAPVSSASVQRVLILGENNVQEVDIQGLRDAANILRASRPDLSDEVLNAANLIAQ